MILDDGQAVEYDSLIVATGSTDSYFGHDDWQRNAPGLKSIEEATEIRHKILYAFEAAEREQDPEKQTRVADVRDRGRGSDGRGACWRAGRNRARHAPARFSIHPPARRAHLPAGRRAASFCPPIRRICRPKPKAALIRLNVTPRTGVFVTDIDDGGVTVKNPDWHRTEYRRANGDLGGWRASVTFRGGVGTSRARATR